MSTPPRHLGAGAAMSVLAQAGPLVAAAVLSVVLARTIGPSGNGQFALLVTLVGIASMVVALGLHAGITYEVSRRRWSVARAFRTSYRMAVVLGLLGLLGGLGVFLLLRDTVFEGIGLAVALVALASLPAVIAYEYAASIMLARERYEAYALLLVAHAAAMLVVGAGLAIPFGLAGAAVGILVSALVGAAFAARMLAQEAHRDEISDSGGSLARALRFGLQSWGANLLQQLNYRFDVVILAGFAATRDVGVYSVALTITGIAWVLPQALQTVLFPRTASLEEAALTGELGSRAPDDALAKALRHGVLLMLPTAFAVIGLLAVGVPILYGKEFHKTIPLGLILLPGVLLLGIGKILSSAVAGRGYPRYALYVSAFSVPLTLALYFTLIPAFGSYGAAIASSISYGFTALVTWAYFRRVVPLGIRESFAPTLLDVADYRDAARLARGRFARGRSSPQ